MIHCNLEKNLVYTSEHLSDHLEKDGSAGKKAKVFDNLLQEAL